jgi:sugar phosphate permease
MENFDRDDRGTGFGLVRTAYILPGSAGSAVTGAVADTFGWAPAYGLVAALLLVAAGTLVLNELFGTGL